MTDEDALFEVWFQLQRRDHWKSLYGDEPFHEGWGEAFKGYMSKAWHARASLHVTYTRETKGEPK